MSGVIVADAGPLHYLILTKLRILFGISVAALLLGGGCSNDNSHALNVIHDSQAAYAALSSYSDTGEGVQEIMGTTITTRFGVWRPNLYRVEWEEEIHTQMGMTLKNKKAIWSAGDGNFRLDRTSAEKVESPEAACGGANSATGSIPGDFFATKSHNSLGILAECPDPVQGNDETIEGVECNTVTGKHQVSGGMTSKMTLWTGKNDHLIHESKVVIENLAAMDIPESASPSAKEALQRAFESSKGKPTIFTVKRENISLNKPFEKSVFVHVEPAIK